VLEQTKPFTAKDAKIATEEAASNAEKMNREDGSKIKGTHRIGARA
jgi:hypothetical protein